MKYFRFVFPFLFVRNWYDGSWELSRARTLLVGATVSIVIMGICIAYLLQAPVIYEHTL